MIIIGIYQTLPLMDHSARLNHIDGSRGSSKGHLTSYSREVSTKCPPDTSFVKVIGSLFEGAVIEG